MPGGWAGFAAGRVVDRTDVVVVAGFAVGGALVGFVVDRTGAAVVDGVVDGVAVGSGPEGLMVVPVVGGFSRMVVGGLSSVTFESNPPQAPTATTATTATPTQ